VRIATRGSALALTQAKWVAERLDADDVELVTVVTSGDRRRAVDDKREWVGELEEALLRGEADLAVHSAKDVPVELADGLALIAAPEREDPRDVLCGAASLDDLPSGARIGTVSLRRRAQVLARRPDLQMVELRGNVDTRLRKLAEGEADAIILAAAGLARLGRSDDADGALDLIPAAGQGILAIEARADDDAARAAVASLRDPDAEAALWCERALVAGLDADCATPVGAFATGTAEHLHLRAFVAAEDGSQWLVDELGSQSPRLKGPGPMSGGAAGGLAPCALGAEVARRLLSAGAAEVLGR
jgi:hydroxymethylbilane synthase